MCNPAAKYFLPSEFERLSVADFGAGGRQTYHMSVGQPVTMPKGEYAMPFLRVDAYEGRSKEQVKELLDAIHRAVLSAFGVPLRDRYQVYQEHSEENFIVQDTGLGIERTAKVVFIGITSRQRTEQQKTHLYTKLVEELKACDIEQNDVVVSFVANSDADWSFGSGRAQFLTGEL